MTRYRRRRIVVGFWFNKKLPHTLKSYKYDTCVYPPPVYRSVNDDDAVWMTPSPPSPPSSPSSPSSYHRHHIIIIIISFSPPARSLPSSVCWCSAEWMVLAAAQCQVDWSSSLSLQFQTMCCVVAALPDWYLKPRFKSIAFPSNRLKQSFQYRIFAPVAVFVQNGLLCWVNRDHPAMLWASRAFQIPFLWNKRSLTWMKIPTNFLIKVFGFIFYNPNRTNNTRWFLLYVCILFKFSAFLT